MPKETFYNLPEEKRQRIIDAAYNEFIEYSYDNSIIQRIAKNAGIPVGSFYQYFYGKDDLFIYLIDNIQTKINKYRDKNYNILDIFVASKDVTPKEVVTDKELKLTEVLFNVPDELMKKLCFENYLDHGTEVMKKYLCELKDKDYLNENVNIDFLSYIMYSLQFNAYMYNKDKNVGYEETMKELNILIKFLFNGIIKNK